LNIFMLRAISLTFLAWLTSGQAMAFDWSPCPKLDEALTSTSSEPKWEVFVSPFTHHWSRDPEHRPVKAVSVSRLLPDDRFCGASLFTNSFGQPSAYAYTGWIWPQLFDATPKVYATVSAGIIYGYIGSYKNKVPLNVGGFSPVIIPAVGYRVTPKIAVEVQFLGNAAVMFGSTFRF
jgi:hypothetical protein